MLRENFRRYVDARLRVYRKLPDMGAVKEELTNAAKLQKAIWLQALAAVRSENAPPQAALVVLPALNAMIDITITRTVAARCTPPAIVFAMLFVLALASSLPAGYGMAAGKSRSWLHMFCFAVVVAVAVHVILDYEYPRVDSFRLRPLIRRWWSCGRAWTEGRVSGSFGRCRVF